MDILKTLFYSVIEVQVDIEGHKAISPLAYDDYETALARYYTVLAAAAANTIPYHSCHIIRSDGIMIEGKVFDRRQE